MKRIIMVAVFTALYTFTGFAQDDEIKLEYPKLMALYINEDYGKLVFKAESMTLSDKTKKEPMPYLYMSMGYLEISKNTDKYPAEKFPKPFKKAVKYAAKHAKKDKTNLYYEDNVDFFSELRFKAFEVAENYCDAGKYTSALQYYKQMVIIDRTDAGALLLQSFCESNARRVKEAAVSLGKAQAIMAAMNIGDYTDDQVMLLKSGIINNAFYFKNNGKITEARKLMTEGKLFFEDDKEFMGTYKLIM